MPVPPADFFQLSTEASTKVIKQKHNWSAPRPDRLTNFWWKKATYLHQGIATCFAAIGNGEENYPHWFTGGKTTLIPKPGEFISENQRPITCLNTLYKWFTSCLLKPINQHLDRHRLMETEQRGVKSKCSGTTDNLLIDRMVCQDSHNAHKNLSMAWIDVRQAFDSVSHEWLQEIMSLHKFAGWICRTVERLCRSWNTRIVAHTNQGHETSQVIHFNKGLPQGDALCPRLFTMCINPIAWKLKATDGYKLSKPIEGKITHLLYVDDMKIFAAAQSKLDRVLKVTKTAMEDIGLIWNGKKCSIAHIKKGVLDSTNHNDRQSITNLKDGETYRFLGILENTQQEDSKVLETTSKTYQQRLSVIWSSPLSDFHKVTATSQYALPALSYPMWTQTCQINALKQIDRESRKIIKDNGESHPATSTDLYYLPRKMGGRGLKSVETQYKMTKVKTAVKLCTNQDSTMQLVRQFDEKCERNGRRSIVKDAKKYAEEMGLELSLSPGAVVTTTDSNEDISSEKVGKVMQNSMDAKGIDTIKDQKWQGKLIQTR